MNWDSLSIKLKFRLHALIKCQNTSASAASSTTDLNGAAALNAIRKIKTKFSFICKT